MKSTPLIINWHDDNAPIYSAHFQPNGKGRLATSGGDNNVRVCGGTLKTQSNILQCFPSAKANLSVCSSGGSKATAKTAKSNTCPPWRSIHRLSTSFAGPRKVAKPTTSFCRQNIDAPQQVICLPLPATTATSFSGSPPTIAPARPLVTKASRTRRHGGRSTCADRAAPRSTISPGRPTAPTSSSAAWTTLPGYTTPAPVHAPDPVPDDDQEANPAQVSLYDRLPSTAITSKVLPGIR